MRIVNKKFNEFSANIRRAIRSLNLRYEGHALFELRNNPDMDVFACFDDNNMLVGWACCNSFVPPRVMLYVRQSMRNKGIGTMIMKEIGKKYQSFNVCPWDRVSRLFFRKQIKKNSLIGIASGWSL